MIYSSVRDHSLLATLLLIAFALPSVLAATPPPDFFSPLDHVNTTGRPPLLGGQNFTRCCLRAVAAWQQGNADVTIQSSQNASLFFTDADQFATSGEQFPCGATYNGDDKGAPQVFISSNWCTSTCGGWQLSVSDVLTQWVQPFVGFVLPAVAFCLNVMRILSLTRQGGWGLAS